ncbi:MAG: 50S ribosomal protein L13 [Candidatus Woesebacteria bacterium GW2011_GWB1_38_5b]|uniref:Large ribosomal subunit protein uL13 n=1 Tax=Candidatus Woesebacteria bacterium GW2011_GWB1_38_5b TaxID=1618569 RepID=A0A0G0MJ39_9BACT|nr:MAG: 50S ribosomal protein L13 [Candidatus Woesebacteria bacterium GW2011_GWB1_38_5b]
MKTYQPKKIVNRQSHNLDAKDQILGRLATKVAGLLMGKHKSTYSTHMDSGDFVTVINAKDIKVTGKKADQKIYHKHSGFPGGYRQVKYEKLLKDNPSKIIELAVKRMLPVNRLRDQRMARLKVTK